MTNPVVKTGNYLKHTFVIHHDPQANVYFGLIEFKGQTIVTSDYATPEIVIHVIRDLIYGMNHIESVTKDAAKMLIGLTAKQIDSL